MTGSAAAAEAATVEAGGKGPEQEICNRRKEEMHSTSDSTAKVRRGPRNSDIPGRRKETIVLHRNRGLAQHHCSEADWRFANEPLAHPFATFLPFKSIKLHKKHARVVETNAGAYCPLRARSETTA